MDVGLEETVDSNCLEIPRLWRIPFLARNLLMGKGMCRQQSQVVNQMAISPCSVRNLWVICMVTWMAISP
jgi:hypothetical protein